MNRRDLENHPLLVGVVNNWHRTLVSSLIGIFKIKADVVEQLNGLLISPISAAYRVRLKCVSILHSVMPMSS